MPKIGCRQPLDAAAHGGQSQIGAVGDQASKQRAVGIRIAWLVAGERPEGAGEARVPVNIQQDIFKPDPGHAAFDQPAQGAQLGRDGECIGPAQAQLTLIDEGKAVGRQPVGERRGGAGNFTGQLGEMFPWLFGQAEIGIAGRAGTRPQTLVQHQRPEPGVLAAAGQGEVAGAQRIADGHRQCGFPERAPELAAIIPQRLLPAGRNEVGRRIVREGLDHTLVEATNHIECGQQIIPSRVGREGQRPEGRQRLAQIRIAGDHGIDHAACVVGGDGTAGRQRAGKAIGADPLTQPSHGFLAIAGEHRLAGVDQRDQPHFGRLSQLPRVGLGRMAGAAHRAGHGVVVRLDHVVQQSLPALQQEAGEQAVAFGCGKATQGVAVIALAQPGKLPHDPMREIVEVG